MQKFEIMKLKYLITSFLLFLCLTIKAQVIEVKGVVIDSINKHPLSFVNIIVNDDGTFGTATDIDGRFCIRSEKDIYRLTCSYVGYNSKSVDIINDDFQGVITMSRNNIELQEVVVDERNNPANRVIDSVSKYRARNNIDNIPSFSYNIYDRMIVTFDTLRITDYELMDIKELVKNNDVMIMETASEVFHKKPNKDKRNIKASIISGMSNPEHFYILDKMQSLNLYDNNIVISQKKYSNPILPSNKSRYYFNLESAIPAAGNDTVFTISFIPRRNNVSNGLKGTLTVHSDCWAIINIKTEPYENDAYPKVMIQQFYEKINDTIWFPKQLNTNLTLLSFGISGNSLVLGGDSQSGQCELIGVGKSFISGIKINEAIDNSVFRGADINVSENSTMKDSEYWNKYRSDGMEERIINTHTFMDSLLKAEGIDLDKMTSSIMNFGENSSVHIGVIDLNLNGIFSYHKANKAYLGLSFNTNEKLSKTLRMNAWGGYFPARKKFNYGGGITFFLNKKTDSNLKLYATRHYYNLGHYGIINSNYNILSSDHIKFNYVKWTTLNDNFFVEISSRFLKIFKAYLRFSLNDINDYNDEARYIIPSIDFKLRAAFGEKHISSSNGLRTYKGANPEIFLTCKRGFSGVLGGEYDFYRLQVQMNMGWEITHFGSSSLMIQAGHTIGDVPTPMLFGIYGNNDGLALYSNACFSTMLINEFFCDRFASVFFSHNFGKIFTFKRLTPELVIDANFGIGSLQTPRYYCGESLKSMDKGYFESGLVLDNIINMMFVKLGFGVYYRYGAYSFDKVADNFAFKVRILFSK